MKKDQGYVTDREGNAVAGAEIYVRKQSDNSLVTLYSDDGVTTIANPTTTDNDGEYSYFTADNVLKVQVYVEGVQQQEATHIQHFDIDGITAFGISLIDDANAAAALTTLGVSAFVQTVLDDADAGAVRTTLGITDAATLAEATTAQYRNNTADKILTTDVVWSAAAFVALAESGGSVAVDLNSGINFTLAMTGNWTLSNPSNGKAGQQGVIQITQDATGSRTLAYGANWKFAGGTDPVLSIDANAIDLLYFEVLSDGSSVYANLVKGIA